MKLVRGFLIHSAAALAVGVFVALAILLFLGEPHTILKIAVASIGAEIGSLAALAWTALRIWHRSWKKPTDQDPDETQPQGEPSPVGHRD